MTKVVITITTHLDHHSSHTGIALTIQPELESINIDKVLPKLKKEIADLGVSYGFKVEKGEGW